MSVCGLIVGFTTIFPVTFIASAFVPISTLPVVLRTIAEWNPVTSMSEALRQLHGNPSGDFGADPAWSLQHPVAHTVIGIVACVAVCAPLAIRAHHRSVAG